jgi:tRNA nucleotidyltransferase (CCA-adding enzyme)
MQIILTHEQADFDALAALLGASLLNETALPVLPRRMNRNARAFLNLYGADLPFVDPRDLPGEQIESILLVDTQSLVTLKGSGPHSQVRVIDHHQRRPDLPSNWDVQIDDVGAVTTLFVEEIQENGLTLTAIQASLLILGIYEDTGSLTYPSTTPRDVRAAAFLLEQGANLRIASQHLNPPLSVDQRQLYERLLANTEWHPIHGQDIIVSCAPADEMNEEISSVAHKIRDLLDPDGLFLLVTTSEGIRLVARSTTDQIDVAGVAGHFGGGGHERAAAALIPVPGSGGADLAEQRNVRLPQVYQQLLEVLPQHVRPSISIGQIMSPRPHLLTANTSAQEAAQMMQRYGYEGYPVVEAGKVIGLLTRRAVDRALAHKLNLPAVSLMEAGSITVTPDQAVEHLQRVMTGSGWGQVPVVDPQTNRIIGIVTRTDLLKTLAADTLTPAPRNLAQKLEDVLPPTRLAFLKAVSQAAHHQRVALYIVGGFVRDLLLDRPSRDFDLVVEGDAIGLARTLTAEYGGQITSHSRFGTAKWDISSIKPELVSKIRENGDLVAGDLPDKLDLITARTEFYERPTALPTVERSSIKLDLHRRDFTINTLALRLDGRHYGELHDYWGGLSDLENGLVRVLHSLSFVDDPTRMLRAVRFEQRFGFTIEIRTLQLMDEAVSLLKQLSGDRIRHELDLILAESEAPRMLKRLGELGLLAAIHPDLPHQIHSPVLPGPAEDEGLPSWNLPARYAGIPIERVLTYLMWLAPLPVRTATEVANRLKMTKTARQLFQSTSQAWHEIPDCVGKPPAEVVSYLEDYPLIALYAVRQINPDPRVRELLDQFVKEWQSVVPVANGETLKALGVPPGPQYRQILKELRSAWLNGEVVSPEAERELILKLVKGKAG